MYRNIICTVIFFYWLLIPCASSFAQSQDLTGRSFTHPGMMQTRSDLTFLRTQIKTGTEPWTTAFKNMLQHIQLDSVPRPYTHISQGPYGKEDRGGRSLLKDASEAYSCALAWYINGDGRYALKSMKILDAWAATLEDFDGNNAKLLAGMSGHYLLNAAELLRYSNSGWPEKSVYEFKKMMLTVYYPLIKDFFPEANGNWDAAMLNTMMEIGVFCDSRPIFARAVNHYWNGNGHGAITKYIYPGGQPQEATRDWGHVQLGLGEFAKAARVAWNQGIDLYGAADNRLARGFEYASKFMSGDSVPVIGRISQLERNTTRDIYESIYSHYHDVKHLNMPFTLKMITKTRPNSGLELLSGLNTHQPAKVVFSDLPQPGLRAHIVGIVPEQPQVRSAAIIVRPGMSIQKAIDSAAHHQGLVHLADGVFTLGTPIVMRSGVTLEGEGRRTILMLNPDLNGITIGNDDPDLHDLQIRNLVIEGGKSVSEGKDPNDDRRMRSFQKAEARGGILLQSQRGHLMKNIKLENLSIYHCTLNGIAVSMARGLIVNQCDVTDNGAAVSPGPGQSHNLLLKYVINATVTHCRLDDSPYGSGILAIAGEQLRLSGNEAARNHQSGFCLADISHVEAVDNLLEGNDDRGIQLIRYIDGCRFLHFADNDSRYNGNDQ